MAYNSGLVHKKAAGLMLPAALFKQYLAPGKGMWKRHRQKGGSPITALWRAPRLGLSSVGEVLRVLVLKAASWSGEWSGAVV